MLSTCSARIAPASVESRKIGANTAVPSGRKIASVCEPMPARFSAGPFAATPSPDTTRSRADGSPRSPSPSAPSPSRFTRTPRGSSKRAQVALIAEGVSSAPANPRNDSSPRSPSPASSSPGTTAGDIQRASMLPALRTPLSPSSTTTSTGRPCSRAAARAMRNCIASWSSAWSSSLSPSQPAVHGRTSAAVAITMARATITSSSETPRLRGSVALVVRSRLWRSALIEGARSPLRQPPEAPDPPENSLKSSPAASWRAVWFVMSSSVPSSPSGPSETTSKSAPSTIVLGWR